MKTFEFTAYKLKDTNSYSVSYYENTFPLVLLSDIGEEIMRFKHYRPEGTQVPDDAIRQFKYAELLSEYGGVNEYYIRFQPNADIDSAKFVNGVVLGSNPNPRGILIWKEIENEN